MMRTVACLLLLLSLAAAGLAVIPNQINYQGYLASPAGIPLDTTVAMTFRIYFVPSGGSALWTESHPAVTVTSGIFHVQLGSVSGIPDMFYPPVRYLGITVGSNSEMTPRQFMSSVPYAYRVETVDKASGGDIGGSINAGIGNTLVANNTAFVLGTFSSATGNYSTIGGGRYNRARGQYSVTSGGGGFAESDSNSAVGDYSSVGGGRANVASGEYSSVNGGQANNASGFSSSIGGGTDNEALGTQNTIAGGIFNLTSAQNSFVGGGGSNQATGDVATVAGGGNNIASGYFSFIGGGRLNKARGDYSVIAGGGGLQTSDSNSATGTASAISGGWDQTASGSYSAIGGGTANTASGSWSTVSGGGSNTASGLSSSVGGGAFNTAAGNYAFVAGRNNTVTGHYSAALGTNVSVSADSAFAWSDGSGPLFSIGSGNTFNAKANGGFRFWTTADHASNIGARLPAGGSAWTTLSDATKKRNLRRVDTGDMLGRVERLPIQQWSYISQDAGIEHVGPTAQDFWNAFQLGDDSLTISTIDPSGVALAAIQELAKRVAELREENIQLRSEMQTLRAGLQPAASSR